jgi:3-oxoacyl-[acyl-carrier protein] reductase
MLLENKNAIIYGAGGSVGSAVASAFAREGAKVFLANRTLSKMEALAKEITDAGGMAEAVEVDALDEQAVEKHIREVAKKAGKIDILFNAIGMQDVQGKPLIEMPLEDFIQPVTMSMRTQFATARAVAKQMVKQGSGVILTISGGPARRAVTNVGGFDTASAAIEALWRTFAAELGGQGIRLVVMGAASGSFDSPDVQATRELHAKAVGKDFEKVLVNSGSNTLLKRLPGVAELANAAVLMASDYASAMTGVIANVTCGYIVD